MSMPLGMAAPAPMEGYVFGGNARAHAHAHPHAQGLPTTYLTPPASTYHPSGTPRSGLTLSSEYDNDVDGDADGDGDGLGGLPFTPAGPLPNPSFSFGVHGRGHGHGAGVHANVDADGDGDDAASRAAREMELFIQFRDKGRLDSLASGASGYDTDGTTGTAVGSAGTVDVEFHFAQVPVQGQGQGQGQGLGLQAPMGFIADRRASA
jgi:hypothetical protein